MNLLTSTQPALTESSVITPQNLEIFLALPRSDYETEQYAGAGPGFETYFALCKSQAVNIVSALPMLEHRDLDRLEESCQVNFPNLVTVLLKYGGLELGQVCELLLWFKRVSPAFDNECFVNEASAAVRVLLQKCQSPDERFQKLEVLFARLNPSGRWARAALDLFGVIFPKRGFTYRLVHELDMEDLCVDRHGKIRIDDLVSLKKALLASFAHCG